MSQNITEITEHVSTVWPARVQGIQPAAMLEAARREQCPVCGMTHLPGRAVADYSERLAEHMLTFHVDPQEGDYLQETLVTDTLVYRVVRRTPKSIVMEHCTSTDVVAQRKTDHPYLAVLYYAQEPNGQRVTVRLRKDGTWRLGSGRGGNALRPAHCIDGAPVRRVDMRM